jgi:hypothetical protein
MNILSSLSSASLNAKNTVVTGPDIFHSGYGTSILVTKQNSLSDICYYNGNIYYSSIKNNWVGVYDVGNTTTNTPIYITGISSPYGMDVSNGNLYVACASGVNVYTINTTTVAASFSVNGATATGLSIMGNFIYVGCSDNSIYNYDLFTLNPITSYSTGMSSVQYVSSGNGYVYVGSDLTAANPDKVARYTVDNVTGNIIAANLSFITGLNQPLKVTTINGNLYVGQNGGNIARCNMNGTVLDANYVSTTNLGTVKVNVQGMTTDGIRLYAAVGDNVIIKYNKIPFPIAENASFITGLYTPADFKFYDNKLYITNNNTSGSITIRSSINGNQLGYINTFTGGQYGIDVYNNIIYSFAPSSPFKMSIYNATNYTLFKANVIIKDGGYRSVACSGNYIYISSINSKIDIHDINTFNLKATISIVTGAARYININNDTLYFINTTTVYKCPLYGNGYPINLTMTPNTISNSISLTITGGNVYTIGSSNIAQYSTGFNLLNGSFKTVPTSPDYRRIASNDTNLFINNFTGNTLSVYAL